MTFGNENEFPMRNSQQPLYQLYPKYCLSTGRQCKHQLHNMVNIYTKNQRKLFIVEK